MTTAASPPRRTNTYNELTSCPDLPPEFVPIYQAARRYTMTSLERMYAIYQGVEQIVRAQLPGAVVECGVWRGGSSMTAALSLLHFGDAERELWLYDTFEGMTEPGQADCEYTGLSAQAALQARGMSQFGQWCHASLEDVQSNMQTTGYAPSRIKYVRGPVEQTIPGDVPDRIALLRLDTDWYESTRHELEHLYPRLVPGGVLIIDDYGHWHGCRRAVDEYFRERPILLNRIDYTGRIGVKPG